VRVEDLADAVEPPRRSCDATGRPGRSAIDGVGEVFDTHPAAYLL